VVQRVDDTVGGERRAIGSEQARIEEGVEAEETEAGEAASEEGAAVERATTFSFG
jgi:hypothetical protein